MTVPNQELLNEATQKTPKNKVVKNEKKVDKMPAFQSLADLFYAIYSEKPKRLTLKKSEIKEISVNRRIDPLKREELLELSSSDRTLENTRELLLLVLELVDAPILADEIKDFVKDVLCRHPAFRHKPLEQLLRNLPDSPGEQGAVRVLLHQTFENLSWPEEMPTLNTKEIKQCRCNALNCLLLWFRGNRGTPIERIFRHLKSEIWDPATNRCKNDVQKLRTLMSTKDPGGIAVACSVYEEEAIEKERISEALRRERDKLAERLVKLESDFANVQLQLGDAKVKVGGLTQELENAKIDHGNQLAHLRNDYEELRGRVLRRFRDEVALLDEGLHALRRDPPKVHVMEDHAERAIDGLKREMDRIKGE